MPKLELKIVQRELEQGQAWPFYWIYGPERLKSRELLIRIQQAVRHQMNPLGNDFGWNEDTLDGNESSAAMILEAAQSLSLGGGLRLIIVRDAQFLKNLDLLVELFGPKRKISELSSICICLAKDLDGRKKFSRSLLENAAVIACEEVSDDQRESWIHYLARRHQMNLSSTQIAQLCAIDPWSLDIIDRELEKLSIAGADCDVTLEGTYLGKVSDLFLDAFFSRKLKLALPYLQSFASHPDESLPLLGLLGWNLRQLAVFLSDSQLGTRNSKLNSFWLERFQKWSQMWHLSEVVDLQEELMNLDYQMKQSPLLPLGLWSQLVTRFCK